MASPIYFCIIGTYTVTEAPTDGSTEAAKPIIVFNESYITKEPIKGEGEGEPYTITINSAPIKDSDEDNLKTAISTQIQTLMSTPKSEGGAPFKMFPPQDLYQNILQTSINATRKMRHSRKANKRRSKK